jgi:hypothetical protein
MKRDDWNDNRKESKKMSLIDDAAQRDGRKPGRPYRAESPIIPWKQVDKLLVFGEEKVCEKTGNTIIAYPSYRDIAQKYGVAHSLISKYSNRHNCLARRHDAEIRVRSQAAAKILERRVEALAVSTEDVLLTKKGSSPGYAGEAASV